MEEQTQKTLEQAETLLAPYTLEKSTPEAHRLDVSITVDNLLAAVKAIVDARMGYIMGVTGLDLPAPAPAEGETAGESHIELLYHFAVGGAVITLRVKVPYSNPVVPSICGLIPSVTLAERENMEMFGVTFEGTPNTDKLLLPEDWPDGVYPLRKSFTGFGSPQA